jgi:hypothetical protein
VNFTEWDGMVRETKRSDETKFLFICVAWPQLFLSLNFYLHA